MEAWQVECERLKGYPEALRKLEEKWEPEMQKSMDYDSKKAYEEWLADYRKMIDIFCEKEWLAEPSTVQHFSALYEYVEIWNRYAAESIPREALAPLKHSEEPLLPLFEDLQKTHDKLRERLARG
jgi:hypothetical protein